MELFRLLGTIAVENSAANKAIDETTGKAKTGSSKISDSFSKVGKKSLDLGNKLYSHITKPAMIAGAALAGIALKKGWSRMVEIDNARAKLIGLGHDGDEVKLIMDNALESVKGTAYGMDAAATTAASAVAAGIPVGEKLTRYLTLVGDAAAIAGTDMSEMGSIFNKVASNGKISAEEMNQLADRGIPIWKLLAETTGMSMDQVREAVSSGKIGIEELQNAIEYGMGGAAKTLGSTTITGAISNIGASISRIGANFLGSADDANSFAGQLLPVLNNVQKWLGQVEEKAKDAGATFGRAFTKTVEIVSSLPKPLIAAGAAVAVLAAPVLQITGKVLMLISTVSRLNTVFLSSVVAVRNYTAATQGASLAAGVANGNLTRQQAIIGSLGNKIMSLSKATVTNTLSTIKDTAANAVNAVSKTTVGTAASGAAKKILAFASANKVAIIATLGLAAPIIALAAYMMTTGASADEVAAKITGFADKLAGMITSFANAFPSMVDGLVAAFTNVINSVVAALPTLIPALLQAGIQLFMALVQSLTQIIEPLVATIPQVIAAVVGVLPTLIPALIQAGITLFMALVQALPEVITALVAAIPQIVDAVIGVLPTLIPALQQASVQLFMAIVQAIPQIIVALMYALVAGLQAVWNAVKAGAVAAWEGIKNTAAEKWNSIKEKITQPIDTARQKVNSGIEKIKSFFSFDSIVSKTKSKWDSIKNRIVDPIETAKQKVQSALNKIKGMFPMSIGKIFSNLKLPHISVDGGKAPFGIGGKGSLPHFSVNWNAKGAIFDEPTIFATAKGLQGVGEAGKEAVAPIDTLQTYVRDAVASESVMQEDLMQRIIESNNQIIQLLNAILQMLSNQKIEWNDRELGRFVKNYAR